MNLMQLLDIQAIGTATSGCNPAAAEANGTKCGRPPKGDRQGMPAGQHKHAASLALDWKIAGRGAGGEAVSMKAELNGHQIELRRLSRPIGKKGYQWYAVVDGQVIMNGTKARVWPNNIVARLAIENDPDKFVGPKTPTLSTPVKVGPSTPEVQDWLNKLFEQAPGAGQNIVKIEPEKTKPPDQGNLFPKRERATRAPKKEAVPELVTKALSRLKYPDEAGYMKAYTAYFADGTKGKWKPALGEKDAHREGIDIGTMWKREILGYEIAKLVGIEHMRGLVVKREINDSADLDKVEPKLGHDGVPHRNVAKGVGAMLSWVEGTNGYLHGDLWANDRVPKQDIMEAAIFDWVVGNTDRHGKNFMVDAATHRLHLIDHGLILGDKTTRFRNSDIADMIPSNTPIPPEMKAKWKAAVPKIVKAMRAHGLPESNIKAMRTRLNALLATRKKVAGVTLAVPAPKIITFGALRMHWNGQRPAGAGRRMGRGGFRFRNGRWGF